MTSVKLMLTMISGSEKYRLKSVLM